MIDDAEAPISSTDLQTKVMLALADDSQYEAAASLGGINQLQLAIIRGDKRGIQKHLEDDAQISGADINGYSTLMYACSYLTSPKDSELLQAIVSHPSSNLNYCLETPQAEETTPPISPFQLISARTPATFAFLNGNKLALDLLFAEARFDMRANWACIQPCIGMTFQDTDLWGTEWNIALFQRYLSHPDFNADCLDLSCFPDSLSFLGIACGLDSGLIVSEFLQKSQLWAKTQEQDRQNILHKLLRTALGEGCLSVLRTLMALPVLPLLDTFELIVPNINLLAWLTFRIADNPKYPEENIPDMFCLLLGVPLQFEADQLVLPEEIENINATPAGYSILHRFVGLRVAPDLLNELLKRPGIDVNVSDSGGLPPLYYALRHQDELAVQALRAAGATCTAACNQLLTSLDTALARKMMDHMIRTQSPEDVLDAAPDQPPVVFRDRHTSNDNHSDTATQACTTKQKKRK